MKKKILLNPAVIDEARMTAIGHGFRDLVRIFRSGGRDYLELSLEDAQRVWTFTVFLKVQAQLHYPGWCDTESGYNADDENAFQEVNCGIFEALRSELSRQFPELIAGQ